MATLLREMQVALYLRRSTNEELQADSLEIQEEILRRYASHHGHTIVSVFRESASGRDAEGRTEFSALISLVASGFADFDAILVRDVSRWGRFDNADESAYYEFLCIRHGVDVVYVEESFGTNAPFAAVMKSMKRFLAGEFSREKSRIITYGQRRATERGFRSCAPPPYGMKRILVGADGAFVQDLAPGVHKLLSCYKTKLAPGDPEKAAIVQRVFTMFAVEKHSFSCIERVLNGEGVTAPEGGRWNVTTIRSMLRNEAYVGTAVWRSRTNKDIASIITENAHAPIVSRELFLRAQFQLARLKAKRADHTTRKRLRHEAAAAVRHWGHLSADLISKLENRLSHPFTRAKFAEVQVAVEQLFATEIADERRAVWSTLSRLGHVEDHGDFAILGGILSIAVKIGWTRPDLVGEPVMFSFDGSEWQDVIVCIGFTANPECKRVFRGIVSGSRVRGRAVNLLRHPAWKSHLIPALASDDSLARSVGIRLYANNPTAELRFLDTARKHDRITFKLLKQELGWPVSAIKRTYRALCERGEAVPELVYQFGRRVSLTCARCGVTEYLRPSDAKARRSNICIRCTRGRGQNKLLARCSQCGAERLVWPCIAKKMKQGLASLCHECSLRKGRALTAARNLSERAPREAKYEFLHEIALLVFRRMSDRPAEFENAVVWPITRRRFATIRWRSPRDRNHQKLILDCTHEFIDRCRERSLGQAAKKNLADAILDRARWTDGSIDWQGDRRWIVNMV